MSANTVKMTIFKQHYMIFHRLHKYFSSYTFEHQNNTYRDSNQLAESFN